MEPVTSIQMGKAGGGGHGRKKRKSSISCASRSELHLELISSVNGGVISDRNSPLDSLSLRRRGGKNLIQISASVGRGGKKPPVIQAEKDPGSSPVLCCKKYGRIDGASFQKGSPVS